MRGWTIAVPIKAPPARKTRLAGLYEESERARLADLWFEHVVSVATAFGSVIILGPAVGSPDPRDVPPSTTWWQDLGRGLNAEVQALYDMLRPARVAVVHADLPMLSYDDLALLLDQAEKAGCAIACDRHGIGTNAIAIADGRNFRFAFGWASFARHLAQGGTGCARIVRPGLACDIDTPADALLMLQPHPAG